MTGYELYGQSTLAMGSKTFLPRCHESQPPYGLLIP
jgi:hypothetical protein